VRHHVVGGDQARMAVLGEHRARRLAAEERRQRRHVRGSRDVCDVGGRLDAEHRDAERHELAQQVAVVARHLHHEARAVEAERVAHRRRVGPGVCDPGRADRREVGVVAEDPLGVDELAYLAEAAGRAGLEVQREECRGRVGSGQQLVRERLEAEVENRLEALRAATAAHGVAARRELLGAVLAFSHPVPPTSAE
jgi:hypothetical protein